MTLANQLYQVNRGKNSPIELPLRSDGVLTPSTGVTRVDLTFRRSGVADITFSSSTDPGWFTLSDPEEVHGVDLELIAIDLKDLPTPPAEGRYRVDVFIWDGEYTSGRFWGAIDVEVRDAPPSP